MNDISNATIKWFSNRCITPSILCRLKLFRGHSTNLKWCIDIEEFVEWRYFSANLMINNTPNINEAAIFCDICLWRVIKSSIYNSHLLDMLYHRILLLFHLRAQPRLQRCKNQQPFLLLLGPRKCLFDANRHRLNHFSS